MTRLVFLLCSFYCVFNVEPFGSHFVNVLDIDL